MRSEAEILKAFEGLDTRPGSRHARVATSSVAEKKRARVLGEGSGWDESPIIKSVRGIETELFTISALAQALEKEVVTIRYWEKKGHIPGAPFRLRSKVINGNKVNGNRVYTRELIEIAIEEFQERGLLGSARVDWNRNRDLTSAIVSKWQEALK
jgi:hypothetical protein